MIDRISDYTNVKNLFKTIATNQNQGEITFQENKDNLALHLKFVNESNKIDYYFVFGNSQVTRVINDDDIKVLTTNPEFLNHHLLSDFDDLKKGKIV